MGASRIVIVAAMCRARGRPDEHGCFANDCSGSGIRLVTDADH
jgi:hypothetical protein